jgi:4'-phosphopantetheinyl transferase
MDERCRFSCVIRNPMTKFDSTTQIAGNEIHVWVVGMRASESQCATLRAWLDLQEIERASRIPNLQTRQSFLVAHGVLRCLLARYLACDPGAIEFASDPQGKPKLVFPECMQFNMTHSAEWAAFAFSSNCTVGVDLEKVRPLSGLPDIIRRVLCAEEAVELMLLSECDRERGFFCCWTRKEAYSKAVGIGLAAFDTFCVAAHPDQPARLIRIGFDAATATAWAIDDLPMPAGYAGALAYPGLKRRLCMNRVTDLGEITSSAPG